MSPASASASSPATLPEGAEILAHTLADSAGDILRKYFRAPCAATLKADQTPVTVADRECEAALRAQITARFPQHGILGEEFGAERETAEFVWVIDPIDGTRSFITGRPQFGTLIALTHRGVPLLGIIDQPILRERWVGALGHPTTLNGKQVRTRRCGKLTDAILSTTSPYLFNKQEAAAFDALRGRVKDTVFAGDCYAYAMLASGYIDVVVEAGLKPYDFCALVPVIIGAGGIITDWKSKPLTLSSDGRVLASGDLGLQQAALKVLA